MAGGVLRSARFHRFTGPAIICGLCTLVVLVYVRGYPGVIGIPRTDQGVFNLEGQAILQGKTPYVDLWDHKGLFLYLLNALGLLLAGGHRVGVWVLEMVLAGAAYVAAYRTLARHFGRLAAACGLAVALMMSAACLNDGNQAESWALLFALFTIVLFNRHFESDSVWSAIGIGACGACQFMMRPNLCGMFLAAVLALCWLRVSRREFRALPRAFFHIGSGIVMVLAPMFVYLWAKGALGAFFDCYFTYNIAYVNDSASNFFPVLGLQDRGSRWETFWYGYRHWLIAPLATLGWLIALGEGRWPFKRKPVEPIVLLGLISFPIEMAASCVSRFMFEHYFMLWAAPMAILITLLLARIGKLKFASPVRARLGLSAVVLGYVAVLFLRAQSQAYMWILHPGSDRFGRMSFNEYTLADYVEAHTRKGDPVYIWGFGAPVNYYTGRPLVSRYLSHMPLITPGYTKDEFFETLEKELSTAHPKLIIDVPGDFLKFLHKSPFPWAQEVEQYIKNNYKATELLKDKEQVYVAK